jgi:hypothetical protein
MARLDLPENQKFRRLALALNGMASGMGAQLARGLLETLWSAAYERADDFLGDAFDVALAADWKGDPEVFVRLLAAVPPGKSAGFIRQDETRGGYVIHDFEQHAPQWVKVKITKKAEREAAGKTLSDIRREASQKSRTARAMQTPAPLPPSGEQTHIRLPSKNDNGTGRDGTGKKSLAANKSPRTPQVFACTREEALAAIERSSGGRFVATKPHKGGVFKLDTLRKNPDALDVFARIGRWLDAGGDWRTAKGQSLDGRHVGEIDAWAAQADAWAKSAGRPPATGSDHSPIVPRDDGPPLFAPLTLDEEAVP